MRGGWNTGKHAPTPLARKQTEARVQDGISKLRTEINRQASAINAGGGFMHVGIAGLGPHGIDVHGEIDLRALYLALDERAARYEAKP